VEVKSFYVIFIYRNELNDSHDPYPRHILVALTLFRSSDILYIEMNKGEFF